jgi:hypothetical protein
MYKAGKEQVNVFGLRTQFGGGKTTGFALVYDSPEAMKKFEPHYRLVRVGLAKKIEKASRQQREWPPSFTFGHQAAHPQMMRACLPAYLPARVHIVPELSADILSSPPQASSARTARRPSAEQRRSRAPRPRRRNRRIASSSLCLHRLIQGFQGSAAGVWLWLCALRYDDAPLHSTKFDTTRHLESIIEGRDGWVSGGSSDVIAFNTGCLLFEVTKYESPWFVMRRRLGCFSGPNMVLYAASWSFQPHPPSTT